jgi:hypothetical protein
MIKKLKRTARLLYRASKHALGSWTNGMRVELQHYRIHGMKFAIVRGVGRGARIVVKPATGWLFIPAERLAPSLVDARMAAICREAGSTG